MSKQAVIVSRTRHSLAARLALCSIMLLAAAGGWGQSRIPDADYQYLFVSGTNDGSSICRATIVFFEVPDSVTNTLYFSIKSPGTSGTGTRDQTNMDDPYNNANDDTTFYLLGGAGAISDPNAKRTTYTSPEIASGVERTGTLLWSKAYQQAPAYATSWDFAGGVSPSQGEHVGNKYYFKMIAEKPAASTRDNYFQLNVSLTPSGTPTGLSSVRAFAYLWAILPPMSGSLSVYPYAEDGDNGSYLAFSNFEGGRYSTNHGWYITSTDKNGASVTTPATSGIQAMSTRSYLLAPTTTNGTWNFSFVNDFYDNSGHIFAYKATAAIADDASNPPIGYLNASLYRIYAAPYTPSPAHHVTISPSSATVAQNGSKSLTLQLVDASGNPVPYKRSVYVAVNGSAAISPNANGDAQHELVTTDGSGMFTIAVTDTSAPESVTVSLTTDGLANGSSSLPGNASNGSALLDFASNPDPTLSSASNTSFTAPRP